VANSGEHACICYRRESIHEQSFPSQPWGRLRAIADGKVGRTCIEVDRLVRGRA